MGNGQINAETGNTISRGETVTAVLNPDTAQFGAEISMVVDNIIGTMSENEVELNTTQVQRIQEAAIKMTQLYVAEHGSDNTELADRFFNILPNQLIQRMYSRRS